MKVNEVITEAGVWQGIKNVGRGIGQIAGGAATGVVYGLDRLAGGSGDVGTLKQRAQRKLNQTTKNLAAVNRELPQQALANFEVQLSQSGIDLNDPTTFNPTSVRNSLRDFGLQFFAGGEDDAVKAYIVQTVQYEPLPSKIDGKTVLNYFKELTKIRSNAVIWVTQNQSLQAIQQAQQAQQAQQTREPARPVSVGGVTRASVAGRDNAGQLTPTRVIYNNKPYALQDDGSWVDILKNKTVNPALASFLQQELESIS